MNIKPIETKPGEKSLITYPCQFPIQVMGANVPGFAKTIGELVQQHDPEFNPASIEEKLSKAGNYIGLSVVITATSREQLDGVYLALTSHPMVKVVL